MSRDKPVCHGRVKSAEYWTCAITDTGAPGAHGREEWAPAVAERAEPREIGVLTAVSVGSRPSSILSRPQSDPKTLFCHQLTNLLDDELAIFVSSSASMTIISIIVQFLFFLCTRRVLLQTSGQCLSKNVGTIPSSKPVNRFLVCLSMRYNKPEYG